MGYLDLIIPCWIRGKAVTSLYVELGKETIDEAEVKEKLLKHFAMLFESKIKQKTEVWASIFCFTIYMVLLLKVLFYLNFINSQAK